MKKKLAYSIRIIVFGLILLILWTGILNILKKPKVSTWDHQGLTQIYKNPNYYDVIFLGTSMAVTNFSNQILYSDYGVAGISLGEPEQMTYLSYYTLEEALKYQKPEAVVFDIQSLYYTDEQQKEKIKTNEDYQVHYSLDEMHNNQTKYNAVKQTIEFNEDSNYWNYFSNMYYRHSNWESVEKDNFVKSNYPYMILGNSILFDTSDVWGEVERTNKNSDTKEIVTFPNINMEYLDKMVTLCNKKDIPLILTRSAGNPNWSYAVYNYMCSYAEKNDVLYIDLGYVADDIGIDWQTDINDGGNSNGGHLNLSGTVKWTRYVMDCLKEKYDFVDRREDKLYDSLKKGEDQYNEYQKAMQDKISLLKGTNINTYLFALKEVLDDDNVAIISVRDEASSQISDETLMKMEQLGLQADLKDRYRYSYLALIENRNVVMENTEHATLNYQGNLDNGKSIALSSSGYDLDDMASIIIDGVEYCQNGRGINVVVYNKKMDLVISSVYFDTYEEIESPTLRLVNGIEQAETNVNVWKIRKEN